MGSESTENSVKNSSSKNVIDIHQELEIADVEDLEKWMNAIDNKIVHDKAKSCQYNEILFASRKIAINDGELKEMSDRYLELKSCNLDELDDTELEELEECKIAHIKYKKRKRMKSDRDRKKKREKKYLELSKPLGELSEEESKEYKNLEQNVKNPRRQREYCDNAENEHSVQDSPKLHKLLSEIPKISELSRSTKAKVLSFEKKHVQKIHSDEKYGNQYDEKETVTKHETQISKSRDQNDLLIEKTELKSNRDQRTKEKFSLNERKTDADKEQQLINEKDQEISKLEKDSNEIKEQTSRSRRNIMKPKRYVRDFEKEIDEINEQNQTGKILAVRKFALEKYIGENTFNETQCSIQNLETSCSKKNSGNEEKRVTHQNDEEEINRIIQTVIAENQRKQNFIPVEKIERKSNEKIEQVETKEVYEESTKRVFEENQTREETTTRRPRRNIKKKQSDSEIYFYNNEDWENITHLEKTQKTKQISPKKENSRKPKPKSKVTEKNKANKRDQKNEIRMARTRVKTLENRDKLSDEALAELESLKLMIQNHEIEIRRQSVRKIYWRDKKTNAELQARLAQLTEEELQKLEEMKQMKQKAGDDLESDPEYLEIVKILKFLEKKRKRKEWRRGLYLKRRQEIREYEARIEKLTEEEIKKLEELKFEFNKKYANSRNRPFRLKARKSELESRRQKLNEDELKEIEECEKMLMKSRENYKRLYHNKKRIREEQMKKIEEYEKRFHELNDEELNELVEMKESIRAYQEYRRQNDRKYRMDKLARMKENERELEASKKIIKKPKKPRTTNKTVKKTETKKKEKKDEVKKTRKIKRVSKKTLKLQDLEVEQECSNSDKRNSKKKDLLAKQVKNRVKVVQKEKLSDPDSMKESNKNEKLQMTFKTNSRDLKTPSINDSQSMLVSNLKLKFLGKR